MNDLSATSLSRRPLHLTEEEAMALLEMCLLTEAEDDPIKEAALNRLGDLCREFLRAEAIGAEAVVSLERPSLRAFDRMMHLREKAAVA